MGGAFYDDQHTVIAKKKQTIKSLISRKKTVSIKITKGIKNMEFLMPFVIFMSFVGNFLGRFNLW